MAAKYVRIHPFDPARGFLVKRYNYRGFTFKADAGWYAINDEAFVAELSKCVQDANAPDPKPVFQIGDEQGALKLVRDEFEKQNPEVKIQSAISQARTLDTTKLPKADAKKPGGDEDAEIPFN